MASNAINVSIGWRHHVNSRYVNGNGPWRYAYSISRWLYKSLVDSRGWILWLMAWWRHQMETFSALLALCADNSPVTDEFPSQRSVTRSFDFFFIYAWTNSWVDNRDAGDLRCHRTHYDATVTGVLFLVLVVRKEGFQLPGAPFTNMD